MKAKYKILLFCLTIFLILFYPARFYIHEFPTYYIVLDPGHGGASRKPKYKHGDRFDTISGTYLDNFREGAEYKGISEHIVVYSIAKKCEEILQLCSSEGDYDRFKEILKKYTDEEPGRINIITYMSRGKSVTDEEIKKLEDHNAEFRLFDFPDKRGTMQYGRLSKINKLKPHLVVSLHLASDAPRDYEGINPFIAAPYRFLSEGLLYLRGEKRSKKFFNNSPLKDWLGEDTKRSEFQWFLSDVSLYFTGYSLNKDHSIKLDSFKGYRYNMVSWAYRDDPGWETYAKLHKNNSKYSYNYKDFVQEGRFWDREQSKYEEYRRDGGYEGFGGDNAYASYELIRYILYSLYLKGHDHKKQKPGKSYVSIGIVPVHVNAINAFLELGYFNRPRDKYILTKLQDEIAEGIAVGIYSLFTGLKLKHKDFKYIPKGKKIDLKKYTIINEKSYFDVVTDE